VRREVSTQGRFDAQAQAASEIETHFDVSGDSGIFANLTVLFQRFSAWSISPSDNAVRQSVIAAADKLAGGIRQLAGGLTKISEGIEQRVGTTVDRINQLSATIRDLNVQRLAQQKPDAAADAKAHAALEELSGLIDIAVLHQPDGTFSVLLASGSPLVAGEQQYRLSTDLAVPAGSPNPAGPPSCRILDWQGADVTGQIDGGRLAGLLDVRNGTIASLLGDGGQAGELNRFTKAFADTVNGILQSGFVSPEPNAVNGSPLFLYDSSDATKPAATIALNSHVTPANLAPVDSAGNANGNARQLSDLADSAASGAIDGLTFSAFLSRIAATTGEKSATATSDSEAQSQVVAQAKSLRDQVSGVSLDEQAVMLLQFQRSYQAVAKFLTTLNEILDTTVNMLR